MKILHNNAERNHKGVTKFSIVITDDFSDVMFKYNSSLSYIRVEDDNFIQLLDATQKEATILHDKLVEAMNEINELRKVNEYDEQPF